MAIKKQASSAAAPLIYGSAGEHPLDALGPLALSAVTVASEGIVRAACDAVAEHPLTARSAAAARAAGREAMDRHIAATASLARRSAEAHSKSSATFKRADNPPLS